MNTASAALRLTAIALGSQQVQATLNDINAETSKEPAKLVSELEQAIYSHLREGDRPDMTVSEDELLMLVAASVRLLNFPTLQALGTVGADRQRAEAMSNIANKITTLYYDLLVEHKKGSNEQH